MTEKEIIFAIHDLHQNGGQDRSTLEIVEQLAERQNVAVHSFTFEPSRPSVPVRFRRVRPSLGKPALLKIVFYHGITALRFLALRLRKRRSVICATGAASLLSDVVHVQFVHASWSRKKRGTESFYRRLVAAYNLFTERLTFRKRKTYIAISHGIKRELESEYGLDKIAVVHHGVDSKKFRPADQATKEQLRRKLGIEVKEETLLLYVGTYERKGLATLIEGLSLLPAEVSRTLRLVAVGAGDQEKFRALARAKGVSSLVQLIPPQKNIEEYFRAADAFVFPTAYEPFGLVILEAMACGLACVVSRAAGAAELIRHGENGWLLDDAGNAAELAELLRVLESKAQVRSAAAAARITAEQRSWAQVAKEYEAAVEGMEN